MLNIKVSALSEVHNWLIFFFKLEKIIVPMKLTLGIFMQHIKLKIF